MRKISLIQNVIFDICCKDNMQITTIDKIKIFEIFYKIESVLPQINGDRKRMINIDFILKQILMMIRLKYKNIPTFKPKRTSEFYKQQWSRIKTLIADDIKTIIRRLICEYFLSHLSTTGHIYIYGDIIKNPQLSQIILIVVCFTSHKGSQMYEDIFITYESKPAQLDFFLKFPILL